MLKLWAISPQACNFIKNELLHTHFSRILVRFKVIYNLLCSRIPRTLIFELIFQSSFQWVLLYNNSHTLYIQSLRLLLKPGPGPWTLTLKNLDPEKPGLWKTWTLKNLDPEKPGINIGLKNMSDFRELCFTKTIRSVSYCLKVRVLTDI